MTNPNISGHNLPDPSQYNLPPPQGGTDSSVGGPGTTNTISGTSPLSTNDTTGASVVSTLKTPSGKVDPKNPQNPDTPILPGPGSFDIGRVAHELKSNPWLASSFLTRLTTNLMLIVKIQKQIKQVEAQFAIQQINMTWELAVEMGNLIKEKAQKEANMHFLLAGLAFASLAIGVAGFGCSMKGISMGLGKGGSKGAKAGGSPSIGSKIKGGWKKFKGKVSNVGKSLKSTFGGKSSGASSSTAAPASTKVTFSDTVTDIKPGDKAPIQKRTEKTSIKPGDSAPADTGAPKGKTPLSKEEIAASSERFKATGDFLTRVLSHAVDQVLSNIVQASFKLSIAETERAIEMKKAAQDLLRRMDPQKEFAEASQAIDQALQFLQKTQDENARAHSLRG